MLITNNLYSTNKYNVSFSAAKNPLEPQSAKLVGELYAKGLKQTEIAKQLKISIDKVRLTIREYKFEKPHISAKRREVHKMFDSGMSLEEISVRTGIKISSLNVYKHTSLYTGSSKKERAQALAKVIEKKLNEGYTIPQISLELNMDRATVNNYIAGFRLRKK